MVVEIRGLDIYDPVKDEVKPRSVADIAYWMVENTLKIEIDEEAFDRLYGFRSHPIPWAKGKKLAVRVVSQFSEESTKVLSLG